MLCRIVEINEDQPDQKSKGYLFLAGYRNGVDHHHSYFGRNPKAGQGVGKLSGEEGTASGMA